MTYNDVKTFYGMNKEQLSIFNRLVNAIMAKRFRYKKFIGHYGLYFGWAIQVKEIVYEDGEKTFQLWFRNSDIPLIQWYTDSEEMFFI